MLPGNMSDFGTRGLLHKVPSALLIELVEIAERCGETASSYTSGRGIAYRRNVIQYMRQSNHIIVVNEEEIQ